MLCEPRGNFAVTYESRSVRLPNRNAL